MADPEDEFIKKYEAHNNETTEDFISRYSRTETEFKDTIEYLIRHREMLRDVELEKLEAESDKLIHALHDLDRERLLEELRCFKDIMSLQRRLVEGAERSSW